MTQTTAAPEKKQAQDIFLPNFCDVRIVFSVIIIAELLAFVLTLATPSYRGDDWMQLGLLSLFVQWIALSWAGLLCALRNWLAKHSNTTAAVISYGLVLTITLLFSELTYWGARQLIEGSLSINLGHMEFVARNLAISAIAGFLVLRYFYLRQQLKLNIEAEHQARMQALQSRIRPHFLFNSLNTIASLIRHQPHIAEEAVEDLADLFRTNLDTGQNMVSFVEELTISRRYIHMEQLRLSERLKVEWDLEAMPEDALIPSLTLQPLLENAIYHGIEQLAEGGVIRCYAQRKRNIIYLTVGNPTPTQPQGRFREGHQVALDNIRQRLLAHFDNEGRVNLEHTPDYHKVTLRFPYLPQTRYENTHR